MCIRLPMNTKFLILLAQPAVSDRWGYKNNMCAKIGSIGRKPASRL